MLGMKPVKFQSDKDFAESITTESKVFSIYAVGEVKGYRRKTRTQIHAVVDFRSAPALGNGLGTPGLTPGSPTSAPVPGTPPGTPGSSVSGSGNELAAALRPSTGGTILYYQVQ
jgi:general secretion pathway protein K